MTAFDFAAVRARIADVDSELAANLGVTTARLELWRSGRQSVPPHQQRLLQFFAASADRVRALEASGLPECEWLRRFDATELPDESDAVAERFKELGSHLDSCAVCQARERFANERCGRMPSYPLGGWMSGIAVVERLPEVLRPAVYGAVILVAIVTLRALGPLLEFPENPTRGIQALIGIAVSACGGAGGGLVYGLAGARFRSLGKHGVSLQAGFTLAAYLVAIADVSVFTDEPLVSLGVLASLNVGLILALAVTGWYAQRRQARTATVKATAT